MKLSNATYDKIKWIVTIFLPAFGALYFAIAQVWDFQRITGVNGTINAIVVFASLILRSLSVRYNNTDGAPDGDLIAQSDPVDGTKHLVLGVNGTSVEDILGKDKVTLNVVDKTATDPRMPAPIITPQGVVVPPSVQGPPSA